MLRNRKIYMPELSFSEAQLKDLMKAALLEILQERQELLSDLIAEALEDIALVKAIDAGKSTETTDRATIFSLLESAE